MEFATKHDIQIAMQKVVDDFLLKRLTGYIWLVGSAARLIVGKPQNPTHDLDIIVPDEKEGYLTSWAEENLIKPTGFGGYKLQHEGIDIDIWATNVADYLRRVPTAWDGIAIHWQTQTILTTAEFHSETNFEITTRRTKKPRFHPYYQEHLRKQGIDVPTVHSSN